MRLRSTRGPAVLGVAVLTAVLIAACGGSSNPSSSTSSSTSSSATAAANASPVLGTRLTGLEACLKKQGVKLPSFAGGRFGATGASGFAGRFGATGRRFGPTGRFGARGRFGPTGRFGATGRFGPTGGRGFLGGGGGALRGLLGNSKFQAALRKCGGFGTGFGAGPRGARAGFDPTSPQDRTEVASFIACMKAKGVNLPTPNFSGNGSVFGTAVNTSSAAFTSAYAKCKTDLKFLASGGPSAGGGAPGA